jgi:hypothetical protein
MDRFFYQLTVLASAACVSVISISILFPSLRQANLSDSSPTVANSKVSIEYQR